MCCDQPKRRKGRRNNFQMIPSDCDIHNNQDCVNGNYICGVVEGFYGRPWTTEERRKLFHRMNKLGMNMYVYAPKDDCKHRMYWRELYSVEEADHLTGLIDAAKESNVTFVYAISPGLDITFSSAKETTILKRKLEQVVSFGCTSFALLFDDIEADMSEADKEIYQSFAHAQVSITNEVFQHLNQPASFLFCPTEYCASRAVPDVPSSEYLSTVGSKLLPGVDILWTGPKVISKKISVKSVIEVTKVLKRPPVIWDNIHANDYDPKRVFLGPYAGRSPELIPYIRGVLTNPNCEFEANYVALHTLSQWSRSNVDGLKKDLPLEENSLSSDIKLETETEGECSDDEFPNCMYDSRYKPKLALAQAIKDWLPEFDSIVSVSSKTVQETLELTKQKLPVQQPVIPTCSVITPTTLSSNNMPSTGAMPPQELNSVDVNASFMQPSMSSTPMNSLMDPSSSDSETESTVEMVEPMDTLSTPGSSPPTATILSKEELPVNLPLSTCDNASKTEQMKTAEGMQIDSLTNTSTGNPVSTEETQIPAVLNGLAQSTLDTTLCLSSPSLPETKSQLTQEDALLLVELFYLPFEYGNSALTLLKDFDWLKTNAYVVTDSKRRNAEPGQKVAAEEWKTRATEFENLVQQIHSMSDKFSLIPNKMLLYNLFPYIWDVRATISIMSAIVEWLGNVFNWTTI